MISAPRTERSVLGSWWLSIDRWVFGAIVSLMLCGLFLVSAASPAVAERIHLSPFHFVYRHILFLVPSALVMIVMSMASRKTLWRVASLVFLGGLILVIATLFGVEVKGATRWVRILGFSLQPSEFLKPSLIIVTAWLLSRRAEHEGFPGYRLSVFTFACAAGLLVLQPDFGMTFVLSVVWGAQICMAGLPLFWVFALMGLGGVGVAGAYVFLPHVTSRIDRFLDPSSGDNYQVQKSLDAFGNGGLFGTGPAHGQVKLQLPDAHADFIFAVAGEELGFLVTFLIVAVFFFIVVRSYWRVKDSEDLFVILGTGGLVAQFALQSLIHMGSSLQLLPAKGMTLPFISYGGSSLLATGFGMGMLLALTRKRTPQTVGAVLAKNRYRKVHG